MARKIGYARVSTVEQNIEAQIQLLEDEGCEIVFMEKVSGKNIEREELKKALKTLKKGDTLVVTSFSRFARNTVDLLKMVEGLENNGVEFKSLKENICTKGATGKLMLTLLGAVATFERELMLEKQKEGIEYAKAQGKYKGKQKTITLDKKIESLFERVERKELKTVEALKIAAISKTTYYNLLAEWKEEKRIRHYEKFGLTGEQLF